MPTTTYQLEVKMPGSHDEVWVMFESAAPFASLQVNDVLNTEGWPGSKAPLRVLRINRIEHTIMQTEAALVHRISVDTEEIDGYPRRVARG